MPRRLPALVLACLGGVLAFLGGVAPAAAQISTATIRVEWMDYGNGADFSRDVSLPYATSFADVGESGVPGNRCVGYPGSAARPDGIIDATDALCTIWSAGDPSRIGSSIGFQIWDPDTCLPQMITASNGVFGINFGGTPFSLDHGAGYRLTMSAAGRPPPADFLVNLVDGCPAGYPGMTVISRCAVPVLLLHVPYDTLYREWDEVLCGQRGFDWDDLDLDGSPDQCRNGIFDGSHAVTALMHDARRGSPTFGLYVTRGVTYSRLAGRPLFSGASLPIVAGDAIFVLLSPGHAPTIWDPPTACR